MSLVCDIEYCWKLHAETDAIFNFIIKGLELEVQTWLVHELTRTVSYFARKYKFIKISK